MNHMSTSGAPTQRSSTVPLSMSIVGNHHMTGSSPELPDASGQRRNIQIPSQMSVGGEVMGDHSMTMYPPIVPMGNLNPQLQPGDWSVPQSNLSSLDPALHQLQTQLPYQNEDGKSNKGVSLTEFTKRRDWPQKLLEGLEGFLHILTPEMTILYASPSGKSLTGFDAKELVEGVITDYMHPDDVELYVTRD